MEKKKLKTELVIDISEFSAFNWGSLRSAVFAYNEHSKDKFALAGTDGKLIIFDCALVGPQNPSSVNSKLSDYEGIILEFGEVIL